MQKDGSQPDVEKVRRLIGLMERRGLSRLVLTEDGVTVRLEVTSAAPALPAGEAGSPVPQIPMAPPQTEEPEEEAPPEGVALVSPTTGTFFRSPAPGEAPFVEVGDQVEVGQTVGIIMAMKVMSEIPSETDGVVVAIPAADGELVHTGVPLVIVRPIE
ncbi:MAG TPA: biotin/lipoyl-containing protein [Armatimonadota bacterium]|jgi:acetyl-CoA carboxylase biotin carboxyl carrier protein